MSIQTVVDNDLFQEESSVWLLKQRSEFGYSDGVASEKYLEKVFRSVKDLSSGSSELENKIIDWPSEYHLTIKRAQLFSGFEFDHSLKVLEVGCGCGAITRYLGETFHDVISVEGSINRARLARLRTQDLDSVEIICAPFQEIVFTRKFDLIFCIGVYEYSAAFVAGENPYDLVLSYFSNLLTPNGVVIIAIENQFGLKYFNSSREDHTGVMYEGLEGYHIHGNKVRTFGKHELEKNLRQYFSTINFYYPYPDYKLPDCVITDAFLSSGRAGELVSQIRSRDYYGEAQSAWDESLVSLELSRNGMLPFFASSFLVFAGKSEIKGVSFNQLAVIASGKRTEQFRAQTRIYIDVDGEIRVAKTALSGDSMVGTGKLTMVEGRTTWKDSYSLQTVLYANCMSKQMDLVDIFKPCRVWLEFLEGVSEYVDGDKYLDGKYVDCIFSNFYRDSAGIAIIDNEWVWSEKIKLNVVAIRAIFTFLCRIESARHLSNVLQVRSLKKLIQLIADNLGIKVNNEDFAEFVELESELWSSVNGSEKRRNALALQWMLLDRSSYKLVRKLGRVLRKVGSRGKRLVARRFKTT